VSNLSGGNQQKVALSKWLLSGAKVLVLDEPTRGVDVGARQEIYQIIRELAAEGVAIVIVSSDFRKSFRSANASSSCTRDESPAR